ncbi:esterase [Streptomyces lasiicapitis]|uniref:Esterase n=1 Tax=Streptomyces lasiicapitis TaxID=1923961 RepID=A0ABQ2MHM5_9ACTN|nr:esterase [Streptomyces lasiicapitis]
MGGGVVTGAPTAPGTSAAPGAPFAPGAPTAPCAPRGEEERRELDREYSPSSLVDDLTDHLDRYAADSARARAELTVHRDIPCGPLPEQSLDYFPAPDADAPLLVFVHGGYWQELSKSEAAFAARDFVAAGISFAALGYGLAPAYSMRRLTAAAVESLRRICTGRAGLPGAPRTVHLAGHSAGAHLVASALLDTAGWRQAGTEPSAAVASATLVSGVYDLELLRHTYVNDALGMDGAEARECSPMRLLPEASGAPTPAAGVPALPRLIVARGENETGEFARQQQEFVRRARLGRAEVTDLVVRGRHHFDLPFDLGNPATALGAEVLRGIRSTRPVGVGSGRAGGQSGYGGRRAAGTLES